ncbi:MAG TPA: T9SS type A sorting domain-containing protein, partial [Candidatus Kapabacteria bacterium]|nr:T9SS type A sorting domain-containing protein [Candidatus Kapabacteria bacterium]
LKAGDTIQPRDSATITVQGVMSWNGNDTGFVTITGTTPFCSTNQFINTMSSASILANAQGTNVAPTYICASGVDSVSVSADSTSIPVRVISAQIVDDPLHPGESANFTFSQSGNQSLINLGTVLSAGEVQKYGIIYTPTLKQGDTAEVIFTVDTASNPGVAPWTIVRKITGFGKQEHTTISVQNPKTGPYIATTNTTFQVPIQMTQPIADGADVRTITMDISFKRDVFDVAATPAVGVNGYTVVSAKLDQTKDPAVLHLTLARTGNAPFDSSAVLANLQLRVMLAEDTTSSFVISNVTFQNSAGDNLCYVLHDTVPATFIPFEYCSSGVIRRFLETGQVSLDIRDVHPNPAMNTVHVGLDVHEDGVPMTIELYNSLGQLVRSYGNGSPMPAGLQGVDIDLANVPSGAYSLRILTPDYTVARTLVVQK